MRTINSPKCPTEILATIAKQAVLCCIDDVVHSDGQDDVLDLAENNAIVALLSSSIRLRAVTIEVLAKVLGVSVIYVDGMERLPISPWSRIQLVRRLVCFQGSLTDYTVLVGQWSAEASAMRSNAVGRAPPILDLYAGPAIVDHILDRKGSLDSPVTNTLLLFDWLDHTLRAYDLYHSNEGVHIYFRHRIGQMSVRVHIWHIYEVCARGFQSINENINTLLEIDWSARNHVRHAERGENLKKAAGEHLKEGLVDCWTAQHRLRRTIAKFSSIQDLDTFIDTEDLYRYISVLNVIADAPWEGSIAVCCKTLAYCLTKDFKDSASSQFPRQYPQVTERMNAAFQMIGCI